ncbi:hypothetical protein PR048_019309 [Dryococelus australis]|uniref:Uncharacterized protein n=1 Tax=Dryococelus australis TaxID=614101 RepID=A0ABQ9H3F9_9NEOP|nr:hypothetical protein PR048_019309 [Dryococelus australis]
MDSARHSGPVDRVIPSGAVVAQWLEYSQMRPQQLLVPQSEAKRRQPDRGHVCVYTYRLAALSRGQVFVLSTKRPVVIMPPHSGESRVLRTTGLEQRYEHSMGATTDLLTNTDCSKRTEGPPRRGRGANPRPLDYKSATLSLSYGGRAYQVRYHAKRVSEEIWSALTSEVLRADEAGDPEKARRPKESSVTITAYEVPVIRPGIEPGSSWWEVSVLIAQLPWLTLQWTLYGRTKFGRKSLGWETDERMMNGRMTDGRDGLLHRGRTVVDRAAVSRSRARRTAGTCSRAWPRRGPDVEEGGGGVGNSISPRLECGGLLSRPRKHHHGYEIELPSPLRGNFTGNIQTVNLKLHAATALTCCTSQVAVSFESRTRHWQEETDTRPNGFPLFTGVVVTVTMSEVDTVIVITSSLSNRTQRGVCSGPYTTHSVAAVVSLCGLRKFPSPDRKEHIAQRSGRPARPGATQTARQSDQQAAVPSVPKSRLLHSSVVPTSTGRNPHRPDILCEFKSRHSSGKAGNLRSGGKLPVKRLIVAVAERLDCSPPTKANRDQSPPRSLRIFASGNRTRRYRWYAGFVGDLPFSPPLHSGTAPFSPHFTHIGSQNLVVKSIPNLFTLFYFLLRLYNNICRSLCVCAISYIFPTASYYQASIFNGALGTQLRAAPGCSWLKDSLFGPPIHICISSKTHGSRGGLVVRLLVFHQGRPDSIPGGVAPGFSHAGIMPDDAACWRFFFPSGDLLLPPRPHPSEFRRCSILTLFRPHRISKPRLNSPLHSTTLVTNHKTEIREGVRLRPTMLAGTTLASQYPGDVCSIAFHEAGSQAVRSTHPDSAQVRVASGIDFISSYSAASGVDFTSNYSATYCIIFTSNYSAASGITFTSNYSATYCIIFTSNYSATYCIIFTSNYSATYCIIFTSNYSATYCIIFTSNYSATYCIIFTSNYSAASGITFTSNYSATPSVVFTSNCSAASIVDFTSNCSAASGRLPFKQQHHLRSQLHFQEPSLGKIFSLMPPPQGSQNLGWRVWQTVLWKGQCTGERLSLEHRGKGGMQLVRAISNSRVERSVVNKSTLRESPKFRIPRRWTGHRSFQPSSAIIVCRKILLCTLGYLVRLLGNSSSPAGATSAGVPCHNRGVSDLRIREGYFAYKAVCTRAAIDHGRASATCTLKAEPSWNAFTAHAVFLAGSLVTRYRSSTAATCELVDISQALTERFCGAAAAPRGHCPHRGWPGPVPKKRGIGEVMFNNSPGTVLKPGSTISLGDLVIQHPGGTENSASRMRVRHA